MPDWRPTSFCGPVWWNSQWQGQHRCRPQQRHYSYFRCTWSFHTNLLKCESFKLMFSWFSGRYLVVDIWFHKLLTQCFGFHQLKTVVLINWFYMIHEELYWRSETYTHLSERTGSWNTSHLTRKLLSELESGINTVISFGCKVDLNMSCIF